MFLYKEQYAPTVLYPKIGAPDTMDLEGRIITLDFGEFYITQVYTPNAGDGLKRLKERQLWDLKYAEYLHLLDKEKPVLATGDFNVAHNEIDLAHPDNNRQSAGFTDEERKGLALDVFRTTAEYDLTIASWLGSTMSHSVEDMDWLGLIWKRENSLRYGENPHQKAAIYRGGPAGIVNAVQSHGKEMSFNNYTDADAAWRAALDHSEPCVAIIKHANPCGVAVGSDIADAYAKAHACDPVSAFGGVVAANRIVTVAMAQPLSQIFTEVIIAPEYELAALEILMKKPSIRILTCPTTNISPLELRPVSGGVLVQQTDLITAEGDDPKNWKQVTGAPVSADVMKDLAFAWRSVRAVKSNAILLAKDGAAVGIGMGQVNRVDSAKLAVDRAGDRVAGSVAASDAFFPFADGLEILTAAGVRAIVQPGGSVRDEEVIAAANKAGVAMFFTGTRHFSHA